MNRADCYEDVVADLKALRLSSIRRHLDDHLRLAQSQSLTYIEFLRGLTREELQGREDSACRRRLQSAHFPALKTLEEFDFAFQPSIAQDKVLQLRDCRWVANAFNLIFAGQSGTGKTHLAVALAYTALRAGYRVYFSTVADLLDQVNVATANGQLQSLQKRLFRNQVIVLDELGYLKIDRLQGNFLFRLVTRAYEKFSLIVTTNKDFSGWVEIFEDPVQVTAMLDRLLHHSIIFNIKGDSYRIKRRKADFSGEK
ncbi:MAG TPA: IS21-like element helper ATPase IstB [Bryobacteraceae bacterium]|jgi:DNA replication protein DnaC|nr:IS21-like element helper ATPase IstB [Bryobacteraceae bacterium]